MKKFEEWQRQITEGTDEKGKKLSEKEKAAIKNKMATQKARLEKKLEVDKLYAENDSMKYRFQDLVLALDAGIPKDSKPKVIEHLQKCIKTDQGKSTLQENKKVGQKQNLISVLNDFMFMNA